MALAALSSLQQTLEQIFQDTTGHSIAIHPNDRRRPSSFNFFWQWATKFKAQITAFYPTLLDEEEQSLIILLEDITTLQEIHEAFQRNLSEFEDQITGSADQAEGSESGSAERCTSDILCPFWKFRNWLGYFQPFAAHLDFFVGSLNKLDIETELKSLVEEAKKITIEEKAENVEVVVPLATTASDKRAEYASSSSGEIHGGDIVLGIEEEVRKIKHLLLGEPSSALEIISLVGMGGIGKTTLARTIYGDNKVSGHFDVRTWITVSQIYDARAVLLSLLNAGKEENHQLSNEELATKVHRSLKFRRYLIIVDDIWNARVWDDIRNLLPDDCNCSRVVVTTRQTDVAVYADSQICNVPLMDNDTSWNLLEKVAFRGDTCPLELADIGINIARKCHGLPLTIVVIAGLLQVNQTRASWENIANDVKSAMHKNDEIHVFDILSLSYNYLPVWLQPCFLYLGRFPEDHKISVSNLIKLWVAEGFLKPRGSKNLEEIGYECLEDLMRRNLVSANRKRRNGLPNKCFVHDLIREMCIKLSQGIFNPRNILFLSIRKALYFTDQPPLEGYESLRVLDAPLEEKGEFPDQVSQVCELVQLRYLSLHCLGGYFSKIPTNICVFVNLQTLVIHSKDDFSVSLPPEIWKLPKLGHLIVQASGFLDYVESEAALPLESLETLLHIQIENRSARFLKRIPNVRKLGFQYADLVEASMMHFIEHLVHLHHLENLNLNANLVQDYHWRDSIFPISLRKLIMKNVRLPWEYMTRICGSLPNLEVLKLRLNACRGPVWETTEGDFLRLKMLEIEDSSLTMWIMESSSHFPRLEHVRLSYCKHLEELPWCMGEVDTLELIEVTNSSTNADEWAESILEQQRDEGNELFRRGRSVPESGKQTWVEDWARARLVAELANNGMFKVDLTGRRRIVKC